MMHQPSILALYMTRTNRDRREWVRCKRVEKSKKLSSDEYVSSIFQKSNLKGPRFGQLEKRSKWWLVWLWKTESTEHSCTTAKDWLVHGPQFSEVPAEGPKCGCLACGLDTQGNKATQDSWRRCSWCMQCMLVRTKCHAMTYICFCIIIFCLRVYDVHESIGMMYSGLLVYVVHLRMICSCHSFLFWAYT